MDQYSANDIRSRYFYPKAFMGDHTMSIIRTFYPKASMGDHKMSIEAFGWKGLLRISLALLIISIIDPYIFSFLIFLYLLS